MFATLSKYFSPVVNQDEQLGFLQIIKPLYVLLAALGLFPRAVEFPDGKNAIVVSKYTTINAACTLLMILLIHSFFVLLWLDLSEDKLTPTTIFIYLVLQISFCPIAYFNVIRNKSLYVEILNDIAHCWDRLAKGKRRLILGRLRVRVNCVVLGTVLVLFLELEVVNFIGYLGVWKKTMINLSVILPEMIQIIMITFYFVMILLLAALLNNIEEEFALIMRKRNEGRDNCVEADLGATMVEMKDVYAKTTKIKEQINAAFQGLILLALAKSFYKLAKTPHTVYNRLFFKSGFRAHDVLRYCCEVFNQLIMIYTLSQSGSLLKSQVNKIGRTLHKIPKSGNQDLKVYLEVRQFSSLMTFHDATISIYGCFSLDATLMFSMVSSAAMYFVILVQFDKLI